VLLDAREVSHEEGEAILTKVEPFITRKFWC